MSINAEAVIYSPERFVTPWNFLTEAAKGTNHFSIGQDRISYSELANRADRLAAGFQSLGLQVGDRIGAIMSDRLAVPEVMFACMRSGMVYVPFSPYLKGQFLAYQIEEIEPKLLLVDIAGLRSALSLITSMPNPPQVVLVEEDPEGLMPGAISLESIYSPRGLGDDLAVSDGSLPAAILYTSGTTGMPKGCVLSQAYFAKSGAVQSTYWLVSRNDFVMTPFPLFHAAGLMGSVMTALTAGASYHNVGTFHASSFMADAAELGATVIMGPGAVGQALLAQPPRDTDRANKIRVAAIVPFPKVAQEKFTERFGAPVTAEIYGQTECTISAINKLDDLRNPKSIGKASPLLDVAIHDDFGEPVTAGIAGEIVIRPKTTGAMFSGYWRKPDATAQTWKNLWHHTGDFGFMDDQGFIYFIDRKKDALRRRGENVSSAELEAAIALHPKISAVTVHALPSEMTEDEIKACIILKPGESISPEELFDFFKASLPYFAVPRYVELLDEFPLTGTGKVRKEVLRARGVGAAWDFEALGLRISRDERRTA